MVCMWLHVIEGTGKNMSRREAAQAGKQVNCIGNSLLLMRHKHLYCRVPLFFSLVSDTVHFVIEISIKTIKYFIAHD